MLVHDHPSGPLIKDLIALNEYGDDSSVTGSPNYTSDNLFNTELMVVAGNES